MFDRSSNRIVACARSDDDGRDGQGPCRRLSRRRRESGSRRLVSSAVSFGTYSLSTSCRIVYLMEQCWQWWLHQHEQSQRQRAVTSKSGEAIGVTAGLVVLDTETTGWQSKMATGHRNHEIEIVGGRIPAQLQDVNPERECDEGDVRCMALTASFGRQAKFSEIVDELIEFVRTQSDYPHAERIAFRRRVSASDAAACRALPERTAAGKHANASGKRNSLVALRALRPYQTRIAPARCSLDVDSGRWFLSMKRVRQSCD